MNYMNANDECKMDVIRAMEKIIDFYDCTDTGREGLENLNMLVFMIIPMKNALFKSLKRENKIKMWKENKFTDYEIDEMIKELGD